jgi:hypothetical protein
MALNFPPSPAVDQIHNDGVRSWKWNGAAWDSFSAAQTVTTVNGMTGPVNFVAKQGITYSVSGGTYSFGINYLRGGSTFSSSKIIDSNDVILLQQSLLSGATMYTTTIKNFGFLLSGSSTKVPKASGEYIKLFTDGAEEVTEKSISFSDFKNELIGISGSVTSFNGLTGAVTGVTTGVSNSFTPIQTFLGGINVSGATFSNNVQIIGDLIVTGRIITETGMFGATYNAAIEVVDNLNMDGGEF